MVFITVSPSAPADSAARAFSTTPSLVSFTRMGLPVRRRGRQRQPARRGCGRAEDQATALHVRAREIELDGGDAIVSGEDLAEKGELGDSITGHGDKIGIPRSNASRPFKKPCTPGFWRPIELTIPAGVSAMRGGGLPALAAGVVVLGSIAPYTRPRPGLLWRVFRKPGSVGSAAGGRRARPRGRHRPFDRHYHARTSEWKTGPRCRT